MCMRMTQFTCKSICFCRYGFWIVQLSSFRSMLCILIALSCWSWFACTISRTINHQHCCWYTICTLIFVLQVSSLCSWEPMVSLSWTRFWAWFMDYINSSFMTRFCDLTTATSSLLKRSSNEFGIFSTPLDVCCGFCILSYSVTAFRFILSSVLTLFACESELTSPVILSISILSILLLSYFWLLWSICFCKLLLTTLNIFVSYYMFGFLNTDM